MKADIHFYLDNVLKVSKHEFGVLQSTIPRNMLDEKGAADKWSAKDAFAHLTYWLEVFSYNIDARTHSKTLIDTDDYLELNRKAWKLRNKLTWDNVRSDLDQAFTSIQTRLRSLTAEQIVNVSCFSISDRPVVADSIYELIEHPMHHWMILYRKASAKDMAVEMLDRVQEGVSQGGLMKWSLSARRKILEHRRSLDGWAKSV